MNTSSVPKLDKGMLHLIGQKLDRGMSTEEVEGMLIRAGFTPSEVKAAIKFALSNHSTVHSSSKVDIADHDFLPPLTKRRVEVSIEEVEEEIVVQEVDVPVEPLRKEISVQMPSEKLSKIIYAEIHHKGLFNGRLRRKDFILGFLFFFGLGFIFFSVITSLFAMLNPDLWNRVLAFVAQDTTGVWLMYIPFMFAPLTVMLLSLIARRLHNFGLPGWISFMYLFAFMPPYNEGVKYSLWGMHIALAVLFVVLISAKGYPAQNKHGALPSSKGSIFKRILGHADQHTHTQ